MTDTSSTEHPKIVVEGQAEKDEVEKTFDGGFFAVKSPIRPR